MAVETVVRFYGVTAGQGNDNVVEGRAQVSDSPTIAAGPYTQTLNSAITLIDTISAVTGTLLGLFVKAVTSNVFVDPYSTALATTACNYIPQGMFNFYSYAAGVTNVPTVRAEVSAAQIELWYYAIT